MRRRPAGPRMGFVQLVSPRGRPRGSTGSQADPSDPPRPTRDPPPHHPRTLRPRTRAVSERGLRPRPRPRRIPASERTFGPRRPWPASARFSGCQPPGPRPAGSRPPSTLGSHRHATVAARDRARRSRLVLQRTGGSGGTTRRRCWNDGTPSTVLSRPGASRNADIAISPSRRW